MGLWGVAAGANPSCLRARAGYSLEKSLTHRRALTDEQWGGSVSCSRTLQHAAQPSPEQGFEPTTFWSLADLLYPLSYSYPHVFAFNFIWSKALGWGLIDVFGLCTATGVQTSPKAINSWTLAWTLINSTLPHSGMKCSLALKVRADKETVYKIFFKKTKSFSTGPLSELVFG